jgi:hypothetical protein
MVEGIVLSLLWIWDGYIASLITFIFVPLIFAVLVISWIVEKISSSNIPVAYFHLMTGLTLIPVVFYVVFLFIHGGTHWAQSE